jgi:hypothetical protein
MKLPRDLEWTGDHDWPIVLDQLDAATSDVRSARFPNSTS